MRSRFPRLCDEAIREGLRTVRWAGRFERLCDDPPVYFDGGHNPDGIARTVETVRVYFPRGVVLVSGSLRDKDHKKIARLLSPIATSVYTVAPPSPRALSAEEYAERLCEAGLAAHPCPTVKEALALAQAKAKERALSNKSEKS